MTGALAALSKLAAPAFPAEAAAPSAADADAADVLVTSFKSKGSFTWQVDAPLRVGASGIL